MTEQAHSLILFDQGEQLPGRIELYMLGRWKAVRIHEPDLDFVTDLERRSHRVDWRSRSLSEDAPKYATSLDFMPPRTHSYRFNYGRFRFSANGMRSSTCVGNGRGSRVGARLIINFGFFDIDALWRYLNQH
jgi:hypothetical protein